MTTTITTNNNTIWVPKVRTLRLFLEGINEVPAATSHPGDPGRIKVQVAHALPGGALNLLSPAYSSQTACSQGPAGPRAEASLGLATGALSSRPARAPGLSSPAHLPAPALGAPRPRPHQPIRGLLTSYLHTAPPRSPQPEWCAREQMRFWFFPVRSPKRLLRAGPRRRFHACLMRRWATHPSWGLSYCTIKCRCSFLQLWSRYNVPDTGGKLWFYHVSMVKPSVGSVSQLETGSATLWVYRHKTQA